MHDVLRQLDAACATEFMVLRPATRAPNASRMLLVIVHPGDALHDVTIMPPDDRDRILEYLLGCQKRMGAEIVERIDAGCDLVQLHRGSSSQFAQAPCCWIDPLYASAIARADENACVLYGDDLRAAATWIAQSVHVAQRSNVLVTGAYGDEQDGCAWTIAEHLRKVCSGGVTLSAHSVLGAIEMGGTPAREVVY